MLNILEKKYIFVPNYVAFQVLSVIHPSNYILEKYTIYLYSDFKS